MIEPPSVIPMAELTACQHLVSTWIDAHTTLLITVGALAVIGSFVLMDFVVRLSLGLGARVMEKYRASVAQGKGRI